MVAGGAPASTRGRFPKRSLLAESLSTCVCGSGRKWVKSRPFGPWAAVPAGVPAPFSPVPELRRPRQRRHRLPSGGRATGRGDLVTGCLSVAGGSGTGRGRLALDASSRPPSGPTLGSGGQNAS